MSTHSQPHALEHALDHESQHADTVLAMPSPTHWPIVLAVGLTLLFAGLVTNFMITLLGVFLTVIGVIGWFRQVLPLEAHELLPVTEVERATERESRRVTRVQFPSTGRGLMPVETYPISSGIIGGFAGGTVMIVLAEIYGVLRHHSIWYVVNLLGGAGVAGWTTPTEHQLASFHLGAFLIAVIIHTSSAFLVGLLYGALLPIMPRRPILLGGLIAPVLWTGLLHSILGLLNPFFDDHINWYWFALSQVGYGVVAGYVVKKKGHLKSLRGVPLSVRLGFERPAPPIQNGGHDGGPRQ
jgi:hypothetical protein